MSSDLVQQTQARQAAQSPVEKIIRSQESGLAAALADRIGTDRFIRAAVTQFRTTPHLDECSPQSLLGGLFVAAQLGLEIGGPRGYAYLVPFKTKGQYEAQLILGYKGLLELAYRSGQMKTVDAFIVREGDTFKQRWDPQQGRVFDWEPGDPSSKAIGAVAYVVTMQGGLLWEYLTEEQILTRRPRYWESTPWKTHFEQMWTKTALKRLFARVRLSSDDTLSLAVASDETVQRRIEGLPEHDVEYTAAPAPAPARTAAPPAQHRPAPPQQPTAPPVEDDQRSQYADEEPTAEQWAEIERQQYEDAMREQEQD
jgi:recombination protein RecT